MEGRKPLIWAFMLVWCGVILAAPAATASSAEPSAAEAEVQDVTLERLLQEAMQRSPGLQAKKRAYEAARGRVISAWLPDDPMFGVDLEGQPDLFRFGRRMNAEYMVAQTIPFPTTLLLRGQAASKDAQIAYQRYKEEERDIAWHLEQPYYELYLTKKTQDALRDVRMLLETLARAVQARYETNRASQQDLLKTHIELAKIDNELFAVTQQEHLAEAHVSHLLDRSLETRYRLAPEEPAAWLGFSRPELEQVAMATRPELKALELGIARAKISRALARTSWLPDLTGRWEARQFKGEGGLREHDTFIGVTVPVWSLLKGAGGEWESAQREVQEAKAMYAEMKNEVLLAVHEAHVKVKIAEHALQVYEQSILPQARQQVGVALASYEAGRTEFLDLIDAERTLKDVQISYYKVKADHERGLSDLRLAVGGTFEQSLRGVTP